MNEGLSDFNANSDIPLQPTSQNTPKKRQTGNLIAGFVIVLFAIVGFICSIGFVAGKISDFSNQKKQKSYTQYASRLISAAAIDIAPFDDITGADMKELVEMSLWSIINDADNPNRFEYKSGSLVVPAQSVEEAFKRHFGTQRTVEHATVQGYGYEFTYNSTENAYYIPITSLTPMYTPKVTDLEKKGNSVTATVGFVNPDKWLQNSETGEISSPEPDKYVKVTFREENGTQYISAVRSVSAPETAGTSPTASTTVPTSAEPTSENESESDTTDTTATTEATTEKD